MKLPSLAVLLAACGGAVAPEPPPELPPECNPHGFDPAACVDNPMGWRACTADDGTRWVFYPPDYLEGGWEHQDAGGNRICRVWGNGAWALGGT